MKTLAAFLISCLLLASAKARELTDSKDSIDEIFYKRQLQHLKDGIPGTYLFDENEVKQWQDKMRIKGSWRWSFEEWQLLFNGFGHYLPEYYYDEELKADNGGWSLA